MDYYADHYYYDYAWVPRADVKKMIDEVDKTKAELAQAKAETALIRKAYEELADSKSKLEAKNERLKDELSNLDAVVSFLWSKLIPAK